MKRFVYANVEYISDQAPNAATREASVREKVGQLPPSANHADPDEHERRMLRVPCENHSCFGSHKVTEHQQLGYPSFILQKL